MESNNRVLDGSKRWDAVKWCAVQISKLAQVKDCGKNLQGCATQEN